ncbi:MAG: hypothetical protein AAF449_07255, partial [Myxococcota bacterium]
MPRGSNSLSEIDEDPKRVLLARLVLYVWAMAEDQPRLHPILDVVAKNAVPGKKEGTVDFDEAGLKTIRTALERLLDKPDLPDAVMAVVAFAA